MKSETFVQHHPPTPPNLGNELQYGLHHVAQHNAERFHALENTQLRSRQGSAYGSPELVVQELPQQAAQQFQPQHVDAGQYHENHSNDLGLGIPYNSQGVFPASPPTPRSTTETSETGRRTRSGRSIALSTSPTDSKPRAKTPPKPKKSKATKADKPKTPKLTAPLSVLTKDMTNIPVRNMEEWVNRSAEERRKEVEKRNGYVTRPMNSFMLYRSAYAERTKQWCLQNNHQIVSSVSGESWPLEPSKVRNAYNEYAKTERINHHNAHPTYKFSPNKTTVPTRKRKGDYSDEEPSDLEDANVMNPGFFDNPFGSNGLSRSTWEINFPNRPMPLPMDHVDFYHQYYQAANHSNIGMTGVEDLRLHRVDTPGASMQFPQGQSLLGLPGGNANDLMPQLDSHSGTPLENEHQVDPMLLAYDGGSQHDGSAHLVHQPEFRNGHVGMGREFDQGGIHNLLGMNPADEEYYPEPWQAADPAIAPLEQGSEFDKWMEDHHAG